MLKQYLKKLYQYYRPVMNWRIFSWRVRAKGCFLLSNANKFDAPILVAGCQRSGTTLVCRLIKQSPEIHEIQYSKDDELDAGYILSGRKNIDTQGRFCFQTTYLNECYQEYLGLQNDFKLIWVIRNPYSVIYSMAYNWSRYSLNELFMACGYEEAIANGYEGRPSVLSLRISPIEKACFSYRGKMMQLFDLVNQLSENKLLVIDYEKLVTNKSESLSRAFRFVDVKFNNEYIDMIRENSILKSSKLNKSDYDKIKLLCGEIFERAQTVAVKYA